MVNLVKEEISIIMVRYWLQPLETTKEMVQYLSIANRSELTMPLSTSQIYSLPGFDLMKRILQHAALWLIRKCVLWSCLLLSVITFVP